jgi:muramoyltetrapeptide carboxypeptidase LdcA involved in peptidoglycan recycling
MGSKRGAIAVIAPSNTMADLHPDLRKIGCRALESIGFSGKIGRHADVAFHHTGGTVAARLEDLYEALDDDDVSLIMPVFGGYNLNQLLGRIDYDRLARAKKPIVGYSDITALLAPASSLAGVPVYHGPGFASFCDPGLYDYTLTAFSAVVAGEPFTYVSPPELAGDLWALKRGWGPREPHPFDGWKVYRDGEATAPAIGGNLETLGALVGTRYFPPVAGKVLFVEDATGKIPGAFHRGMTQLQHLGVFEEISGLVVGAAPHGTKLAERDVMTAILDDVLPPKRAMPILFEVNCSHVDPMMTIPLDVPCRVSTTRATIEVNVTS